MMNFDEIIVNVKAMENGNTVAVYTVTNYTTVEFLDFEGFDGDWNELENPDYDEEVADNIYDMIVENTIPVERNFLKFRLTMDGKLIHITFSSDDI